MHKTLHEHHLYIHIDKKTHTNLNGSSVSSTDCLYIAEIAVGIFNPNPGVGFPNPAVPPKSIPVVLTGLFPLKFDGCFLNN